MVSDVARSKSFYQRLAGLPVRDEDKDFCELRLDRGFLGLYKADAATRPGIDHFCLGVDGFEPHAALVAVKRAAPDAQATLENSVEVYTHDPDGVRVQFADVRYKS